MSVVDEANRKIMPSSGVRTQGGHILESNRRRCSTLKPNNAARICIANCK